MAKKLSSGKTSTDSLSSSVKKPVKKTTRGRKKISYKQEYVKLLEKTNKVLLKEVKTIRKAIVMPKEPVVSRQAFPKEPTTIKKPVIKVRKGTVQEQILDELAEISYQIKARDTMFDDLVNGSGKITGDYFND
jgi:hypothetical protein